jgi:hypothetical protein
MGHADANTLMRYAHIEPDPLADLLPLLHGTPELPPRFPPISSSSPPDDSNSPENLDRRAAAPRRLRERDNTRGNGSPAP